MTHQGTLPLAVLSRSGGLRECPVCQTLFEPYKRAESRQIYCSQDCRTRHWKVGHGVKVAPKPTKRTRAEKILDRLRQGKATGLELLQAGGGTRYSARIFTLRDKGHRIHGPFEVLIYEPGRNLATVLEPIPKTDDGHELYELREGNHG